MFHYNNQNSNSSRRLTSNDRLSSDSSSGGAYFHPYDEAGVVPGRAPASASSHARSSSDFTGYSSSSQQHQPHSLRQSYPVMEMEAGGDAGDEIEEPMEILYESQVRRRGGHSSEVGSGDLELQMTEAADHLLALLQREANDYSVPLPIRYYPTEFAEVDSSEDGDQSNNNNSNKDGSSKKTTIGPWRKRIASWMYDVVDHFQYDRNVVSIALRYIDQYVGHLLVENSKLRRSESGITVSRGNSSSGGSSSGNQPIKRRHFQLIAVTSLYLAIKVHGELMEDDPVSGARYDAVESLVHEVDGRSFLQKPLTLKEAGGAEEEEESEESDDDLRAVHSKISDLKRRQRRGRWSMRGLSQFGLPLANTCSSNGSSNAAPITASVGSYQAQPKNAHSGLPYKPRKRGMLSGPLRLHSFVELSRGLFTAQDITGTERKILEALNYVVNPPTSRRFAGELLRLLALSYCSSVDSNCVHAEATATAAERVLGLKRKEILDKVLSSACKQIEGAASVPSLSIGCLPSVVAYASVLNAVEEEFEKIAAGHANNEANNAAAMETEKNSPQLEDFQRHYRRYSRNQSPVPAASAPAADAESDKEVFLDAWKEQWMTMVFHATNCFFSPDSQDIFKVRELLLEQLDDAEARASVASPTSAAASPNENSKDGPVKTKRSPRSPRSVTVGPNPRMLRGGSFFRQSSSMTSRPGSSSSRELLSPYDARGRVANAPAVGGSENGRASFRSVAASNNAPAAQHRAYYKQTSEPIAERAAAAASCVSHHRFARAQTPEVTQQLRTRVGSGNYDASWRSQSSTGEAFQPPNPNPPFFSA